MTKTFKISVLFVALIAAGTILIFKQSAYAHCQIPCGIYNDYARVQSMLEDVATIEKSVKLIGELSGKTDPQSLNQLFRWVMNKEEHAQHIISTISDYFLTQRVKPGQEDYSERLIKHHKIIIAAMKAKQNTDISLVKDLREGIEKLSYYYPEHKH